MDFSILGDVSNVVATGLAVFSLCLTWNENKTARKFNTEGMIKEQKFLWYNDIVLNNILKHLSHTLENTKKIVDDEKKGNNSFSEMDFCRIYRNIRDGFNPLREDIMILKVFSPSLYYKCKEKMEEILDIYSDAINKAASGKTSYIYINLSKIQKNRTEMIQLMYNFIDEMEFAGSHT